MGLAVLRQGCEMSAEPGSTGFRHTGDLKRMHLSEAKRHAARIPFPPWGAPRQWREADAAVVHLIRRHEGRLTAARTTALQLKLRLQDLFGLLERLCARTCPWCPDPCCLTARAFFDLRDMLFCRLAGVAPPPGQLWSRAGQTCRYCGPRGCRLPRLSRPWICNWYLCPTQQAALRRMEPLSAAAYRRNTAAVKYLRGRLEALFVAATA